MTYLTEIPDLGDIAQFVVDTTTYTLEFWERIRLQMLQEQLEFESVLARQRPQPEDYRKCFNF